MNICFVTYEIYPTTWGGCGVLLHHAAELLLRAGHRVIFLLDIPRNEYLQFARRDRLTLSNPENCVAYDARELGADVPWSAEQLGSGVLHSSLRFARAMRALRQREKLDFVEFFDYCGVAHHTLVDRLFADDPTGEPIGIRLHNTIELIDRYGVSRHADRERYRLYALERAALQHAEAILTPTKTYFDAYYRDRYAIDPARVVVSQSPKLDTPRRGRRPDPRGEFSIAYVGRMFHFKGVDQLVHAAVVLLRRRPELRVRFELIGPDSPESPFGASQIEYLRSTLPPELRDRFVFTGHLSHAQIAARLESALFGVFPNRFESFCYALHEVYDAGVPVIVNRIPGLVEFFEHEKTALLYDGSTEELVAAMERMLDDAVLRERLTRPHPIADRPLGPYYAEPRATAPVVSRPEAEPLPVVVAVLCPGGLVDALPTLAALRAQTHRDFTLRCLLPASDDAAETFWWLGSDWRLTDENGAPVAQVDFQTREAIVILQAGDRPAPGWLGHCARALGRRPDLGFTGTWAQSPAGVIADTLDITPELAPFDRGAGRLRVLLRTKPGRLVADLFDANLADLGEIGCLWRVIEDYGPGRLSPEVLMNLPAAAAAAPASPALIQYLLAWSGPRLAGRLALAAGQVARPAPMSGAAEAPSVEIPGVRGAIQNAVRRRLHQTAERLRQTPLRPPLRWLKHRTKALLALLRRPAASAPARRAPRGPSPAQQAFIERFRSAGGRAVAVHCPRWLGVSSSTRRLFEHCYPAPESPDVEPYRFTSDDIARHADVLIEAGARHVIFSGGDEQHLHLLERLKQRDSSIRCDLLWHGNFVQFSEDYGWQNLQRWISAARTGLLHSVSTVKQGMEEFFRSRGLRSHLILNYVDELPDGPSPVADRPRRVGLWMSGTHWKSPFPMLASLRMLPDVELWAAGLDRRSREVVEFFNIECGMLRERTLPFAELLEAMRQTHATVYVTFCECCPMLPLESFSVGVPCIVGPTSHLFADDPWLAERLIVPYPDRPDVIAQYLERVLAERAEIVAAYRRWAPGYVAAARKSVADFLAE